MRVRTADRWTDRREEFSELDGLVTALFGKIPVPDRKVGASDIVVTGHVTEREGPIKTGGSWN